VDFNQLDEQGWDSKGLEYIVKARYNSLLQDVSNPLCSRIWQFIWKGDLLPKINVFNWLMVHGRLLTVENYKKEEFRGHPYVLSVVW
jgi:hypothetical protein